MCSKWKGDMDIDRQRKKIKTVVKAGQAAVMMENVW
jgi:hypothetical protein